MRDAAITASLRRLSPAGGDLIWGERKLAAKPIGRKAYRLKVCLWYSGGTPTKEESQMTIREDKLPYPIDCTIIDMPYGDWFLAYDQAEGFQPMAYAICANDAGCADEVWAEQERNRETDTDQLVVVPLRRNIPTRDEDSGRYVSGSDSIARIMA